jgi:hypothetical protein
MMSASVTNRHAAAVPARVVHGVRASGWPGVVLPRTRVSEFAVYPVVEIDEQVWAERVENGHGPELDRSTLLIWESWTADLGEMPPRSPLSIVGFVSSAEKPGDALYALESLAGYGAGLWIVCGARGPSPWSLSEFDLAGASVVWDHKGGRDLVVEGRRGQVATARRMASTRHKEELLFGWALATGYSPVVAVSTTPTL